MSTLSRKRQKDEGRLNCVRVCVRCICQLRRVSITIYIPPASRMRCHLIAHLHKEGFQPYPWTLDDSMSTSVTSVSPTHTHTHSGIGKSCLIVLTQL